MPPLGAYGLRLNGLTGAERWMQAQAADAPLLSVSVHPVALESEPSSVTATEADLRLLGGGRLRARRGEGSIQLHLPARPSPAELLHPYLAPGAALIWQWEGQEALHAGVVEIAGRGVLVFGAKAAGKSTTLAWLAEHLGLTIISDDLAVVVDGAVLAGPRSIDLRAVADSPSESAEDTSVRQGQRLRRSLSPAPAAVEIAGAVLLDWGAELLVEPISPLQRLQILGAQRSFSGLTENPLTLFEIASRPMVRIIRPQDPATVAATAQALVDHFT